MKKTVIFDVDGTLYYQNKVRICMAVKLVQYCLFSNKRIRDVWCIFQFRKKREMEMYKNYSIAELISDVAVAYSVDEKELSSVINDWLFVKPLEAIRKYMRKEVIGFLNEMRTKGYQIVIYSDYPVEDKLKILDIKADRIFYPSDHTFSELKPDKSVMEHIVENAEIDVSDCYFIGDRDEKDGISAGFIGAKYYNVKKCRIESLL